MIAAVFALALTFTTPAAMDCTADARATCAELMGALYRSADPATGQAWRLIDGEAWRVEPVALVPVGDHRALIVSHHNAAAPHAAGGSWSAYYFAADAPRLISSARDFRSAGSWGHPGRGAVTMLDGGAFALAIEAGGMWQGDACLWISVDAIEAQGLRPMLADVLVARSGPGERELTGSIVTLSERSAVLEYSDGSRIVYSADPQGALQPATTPPTGC